ncbi:LutC/YkgG family protein [Rubrimonas sp.]|uniref:LutC/YkgG family protein n=1 Tax=Rubrimonas sp. TaxID=2036015 RepID=UPI002FDD0928
MSAREAILNRLRKAVPADPARAGTARARLADRPAPSLAPAIAQTTGAARLDRFEAKATAVSATVSRLSAMADLPAALAAELRARNLPAAIRCGAEPAFAVLDWGGVEVTQGPGRIEEPAGLSLAQAGIAETGTLVLASGPENPVTLTFLSETHFVVLRASDMCGGFEDFWTLWRSRGLDPRTLNMVTGPSRSADIGQTLQLGAHGPVALHIFLIEGE